MSPDDAAREKAGTPTRSSGGRATERTNVPGIFKVRTATGEVRYKVVCSTGKDPATGRYRQRARVVKTFKAAKEAKAQIEAEVAQGTHVHADSVTVAAYMADWLAARRHKVKPSTLAAYEHHTKYVTAVLGAKAVQKVTRADVTRLVDSMLTTPTKARPGGLSRRTVNHTLTMMVTAFGDAKKDGLVARNVFSDAGMVSTEVVEEQREFPTWTAEQMQAFQGHVADDRLSGVWTLLGLGMRLGEACGVAWDDVDLDAGTVTVRRTRTQVNGHAVLGTPKSKESRRTLVLGPQVVARLRAAKRRAAEERLAAGSAWSGGEFVCSDEIGRPYSPEKVQRRFHALREAAGLPRIRLHDVRHSSVTAMLKAGTSPTKVAKHHGHNVSTMLRIYSHVVPDEETAAASDALFG